MDSLLIVTMNLNNFDSFKEHRNIINYKKLNWYYITDNKDLKSDFYKIIHIDEIKNKIKENIIDTRVLCKYIKMNQHILFPEFKYYLHVDASFEIKNKKLYNLLDKYIKNDLKLIFFKHNKMNSIAQEIRWCFDHRTIPRRMAKHLRRKYCVNYVDNILYETGIYFRKNDIKINKMCNEWYIENRDIISRDQISLPYVLFKNDIKPDLVIVDNIRNNPLFGRLRFHNK